MTPRTLAPLYVAALLLCGASAPARAESIPTPTGQLKDFEGRGVVQIEVPPTESDAKGPGGEKVVTPGMTTWFVFRQVYVRQDRHLLQLGFLNTRQVNQAMLVSGSTERTWAPGTPYVVERIYKNLDSASENPSTAVQMSMATYARVFREVETGKILPAEDLDALKTSHTARLAELKKLREEFAASKNVDNLNRSNAAAAESARLRDDLDQHALRRANPCWVVEFPNKDLIQKLFARGLFPASSADVLAQGKTRVWITKAEGLPIKIETAGNDGQVALFICFKDLKINAGIHPGEVILGTPPGIRIISATADLKDRNWEEKLDKYLSDEIDRFQEERRRSQLQQPPITGRKKPRN